MKERIDIVLAFFNGSKFIAQQIESIESNLVSGTPLVRLIIIDDASEESELKFLHDLCKNKPFIEIHSNSKNFGVMKSFEKGISLTTAPFVMLCDQDDYWLPRKVGISLQELKKLNPLKPGLVFTDVKIVDEQLCELHGSMFSHFSYQHTEVFDSLLYRNIVTGCTVMFNRSLIDIALPFPEKISMHDHWLAICAAYCGELRAINQPTMLYRQHGSNQVGAPSTNRLLKVMKLGILLPKHLEILQRKVAQMRALGEKLEMAGEEEKSRKIFKIADRLESGSLVDWFHLIDQNVIHRSPYLMLVRALLPRRMRNLR